jgi:signal peptidase I
VTELQLTPSPSFPDPKSKTSTGSLLTRILIGVLVAAAVLVIGGFITVRLLATALEFKAFRIPTSSMCPTICHDERLIASMNAYQRTSPKRGDVILHRLANNTALFTKRVVGIAGDTVSPGARNEVLVSGNPLTKPLVCGKPVLPENLSSENSTFKPVKIPEGYVFVIGDNLSDSYDSRHFGLV